MASPASSTVASQPFSLSMRPSLPPHAVLADLAGLAARETERPHAAVAGQDRAFHLLQEADGAADAVAGVPLPLAAGALADVEILQQHRDSAVPGSSGSVRRVLVMWVCTRVGAVESPGPAGEPEQIVS